jgi:hypothetical protein
MAEKLELKDVIAIGRTFDEYCRMFDLTFTQLKGAAILDAGGGVSSFTAEACGLGLNVKSADRIYGFAADELAAKSSIDLEEMLVKLPEVAENYNWDFYKDIPGLAGFRREARKRFLADYQSGHTGRYVKTEFPDTVFTGKEFDIAIMSHFIFLYDEHLDYNFHRDVIAELIRITREEIRIYPLLNLRWKRSAFVDRIINDAGFSGVKFSVKKCGFEFVKGADEYLVIKP